MAKTESPTLLTTHAHIYPSWIRKWCKCSGPRTKLLYIFCNICWENDLNTTQRLVHYRRAVEFSPPPHFKKLSTEGNRSVGTILCPGREASYDGNGDRKLMVRLAVGLLCSAGQPFSHQFDMRGILLSSKDAGLGNGGLFTECQVWILSLCS